MEKQLITETFKEGDKVYAIVGNGRTVKGIYAGKKEDVDGKMVHSIKSAGKITLHPKIKKGEPEELKEVSFSRIPLESEDFDFPTYYDIKYGQSSRIFESEEIQNMTPDQIQEAEKAYYQILEKLNKGEEVDEGFLGALAGGAVGALAGPAIGRAICKALGIEQEGTLGKLLTSRLVTTAIGIALGK